MLGSHHTIVIVGGGAGGHACCRAYREAGGEAPVLLLSADDRLPYFRPHVARTTWPARVEHWGEAEAHGRTAGLNLAGQDAEWRTVPGFWSTISE